MTSLSCFSAGTSSRKRRAPILDQVFRVGRHDAEAYPSRMPKSCGAGALQCVREGLADHVSRHGRESVTPSYAAPEPLAAHCAGAAGDGSRRDASESGWPPRRPRRASTSRRALRMDAHVGHRVPQRPGGRRAALAARAGRLGGRLASRVDLDERHPDVAAPTTVQLLGAATRARSRSALAYYVDFPTRSTAASAAWTTWRTGQKRPGAARRGRRREAADRRAATAARSRALLGESFGHDAVSASEHPALRGRARQRRLRAGAGAGQSARDRERGATSRRWRWRARRGASAITAWSSRADRALRPAAEPGTSAELAAALNSSPRSRARGSNAFVRWLSPQAPSPRTLCLDLVALQQLLADHHALDLARALADQEQRRVAVEALDLVLLRVAVAAVDAE